MTQRRRKRRRNRVLRWMKNTVIYLAARPAMAFAAVIPLSVGLRLGAFLGRLAFAALRSERRKMLRHLRIAFPEKEESWRVGTAGRMCANLGRSAAEFLHFEEILDGAEGEGKYSGYVIMQGEEHLEAALARGRGGLVVTGHCGNWELMAAFAVRKGFALNPVTRRLYDARLDRVLNARRVRFGYHPIPRDDRNAAVRIARALRRNELVGLLMDQDTKVPSVFVPFFGRLANTPSGPAYLAYRMGMDCLTAFIHRRSEGGHLLEVGPPVPRPQTGNREADVAAYTALLTRRIEEHVRRHPDEWVWMHRRWRRRPPGEPPDDARESPVVLAEANV